MTTAPFALRALLALLPALPLAAAAATPATTASTTSYQITPEPAWVVHEAPARTATQPATEIEVLLWDHQSNMTGTGANYFHRTYRPVSASGVGDVAELRIQYNPEYQQLHLHSIQLCRGQDCRELVSSSKIRLLQREESLDSGIQDGRITADILLDDVRVGDVVDYSYTIEGSNPVFGDRQFGFAMLNGTVPIERLNVRVLASSKKPLYLKVMNGNLPVRKQRHGDLTEYSVHRDNVSAATTDENTPGWYSPYAWLEFSEYASWAEVQQWADALYDGAIGDRSTLSQEAARLRAASQDDADFITRALFFVQNEIRYVGLELGSNSHLPHSPAEVLAKRYGDCKDKSLLLAQILRAGGIQAYPALVSTQTTRGIAEELPSPGVFDHVIVRADLKGHSYWLDGTRLYQAGTLEQLGRHDYGYAFVIGDGSKELQAMYSTPPRSYHADVVQHFSAQDFSGPVSFEVESRYDGNGADYERYLFKAQRRSEIEKRSTDFYAYYYPGIRQTKPTEIVDDSAANRITIREFYEIPDYWQKESNLLAGKIILTAFADLVHSPRQVNRSAPYALPSPRLITETTYFKYPVDVGMRVEDAVHKVDFNGVHYSGRDHYQDSIYIHRSSLKLEGDHVDAKDMPAYAKAIKSLQAEADFTLRIATPEHLGLPQIDAVKNRLKTLAQHPE